MPESSETNSNLEVISVMNHTYEPVARDNGECEPDHHHDDVYSKKNLQKTKVQTH